MLLERGRFCLMLYLERRRAERANVLADPGGCAKDVTGVSGTRRMVQNAGECLCTTATRETESRAGTLRNSLRGVIGNRVSERPSNEASEGWDKSGKNFESPEI